MTKRGARSAALAVGSLALVGVVPTAFAANAHVTAKPAAAKAKAHVTVIASKLDGPYGLAFTPSGQIVVAQGDSGNVVSINPATGAKHTLLSKVGGVSGVAVWNGVLYAVNGGPDENGNPAPGKFGASVLIKANASGSGARAFANLLTYEKKYNPDGQVQLVKGKPVDALSNPFSMNASSYGLFVADGGANDVLRVNRDTGKVTTFFVPPTSKIKACLAKGAQANPGTVGCDPVPTGIAVYGGHIYIATLGAEVPGAGAVYELTPSGKVVHVFKGFDAPTGIAVSSQGIFVSEVVYGAPAGNGPPPPGFDPSTVGRITRISHGVVTHANVTMPTGLAWHAGHLYASTWSIAGQVGIQHAGQIQLVHLDSFK